MLWRWVQPPPPPPPPRLHADHACAERHGPPTVHAVRQREIHDDQARVLLLDRVHDGLALRAALAEVRWDATHADAAHGYTHAQAREAPRHQRKPRLHQRLGCGMAHLQAAKGQAGNIPTQHPQQCQTCTAPPPCRKPPRMDGPCVAWRGVAWRACTVPATCMCPPRSHLAAAPIHHHRRLGRLALGMGVNCNASRCLAWPWEGRNRPCCQAFASASATARDA